MAGTYNQEYHYYIDYLSEQKFYGKITFHFQNGIIENSFPQERHNKTHIKDKIKNNGATREKTKRKKSVAKRKEPDDALEIPDEAVIDRAAFDWGEEKLTRRQKLCVAWFRTPGTAALYRRD